MLQKTVIISIILFATLYFAEMSESAPNITSLPSSASNGQIIKILGSGFGTKSNPKPFKWDDFEARAIGSNVNSGSTPSSAQETSPWDQHITANSGLSVSNSVLRTNSTRSVFHNLNTSAAYGYDTPSGYEGAYYVSFWHYYTADIQLQWN